MSTRTGLGPVEMAVLSAVESLGGLPAARYRRSTELLGLLDREWGLGPRYAYLLIADLGAAWRLHLPLLDCNGNWGGQSGDPPADARYTEVRLSPIGSLALAAERQELGPVPLGLIEGSLYRGGPVPPFGPAGVLGALRFGAADAGPPVLPTGGQVNGQVEALLAGKPARLQLSCTIEDEISRRGWRQLVITEVPLGVPTDRVVHQLQSRSATRRPRTTFDGTTLPPAEIPPIADVHDETSGREGIRIVCVLRPDAERDDAERWIRSVWPVSTYVDCQLPAPMSEQLNGWDSGDGSGLRAMHDLL